MLAGFAFEDDAVTSNPNYRVFFLVIAALAAMALLIGWTIDLIQYGPFL